MSQAVVPDDAPVDPDDELLVSYLDGELDAKSENELMNRLMNDQQLNQRLQQLQEGWDWLDTLPNATPSEKLVESTLELVVADVVKSKPGQVVSRWDRYKWFLALACTCVAAVGIALAIVTWVKSTRYQQQLRDLELAEHLDAYLRAGDLNLMRQLDADTSWSQMVAAAQEIGEFSSVGDSSLAKIPIEQRAEALANLPLEGQPELAARWNAFQRLDERSEQEVRRTAAAVAVQPDSETLLRTMELYSIWIEKLPTELRDKIESDNPKVRREAIDQAIEITQQSTMQQSRDQLSDEAVERIYFALSEILHQRIDAGDEATINRLRSTEEWASRVFDNADPEPFVILAICAIDDGGPGRGRSPRPQFGGRGRRERPAPLRNDELEMIRLILPDDAHDMLQAITSAVNAEDTLALRNLTLRIWAEAATRQKMRSLAELTRSLPPKTLLDRYEELPPRARERIDLLPPEDMFEEMTPNGPPR